MGRGLPAGGALPLAGPAWLASLLCLLQLLPAPGFAGGLECRPRARAGTAAGAAGAGGFRDGIGTARFQVPGGLAVGAGGELFVADTGNSRVRRVQWEAGGKVPVVTTVVGGAGAGFADGPSVLARLSSPRGLAYAPGDPAALFVADEGNSRLRRVTLDGATRVVATVAGSSAPGHRDHANPAQAQFDAPADVAYDAAGGADLYVADAGSHTIRRVRLIGSAGAVGVAPELF